MLIDGAAYWLGATYGVYVEALDCFELGNCFVPRSSTTYRD